jgi:hypothetical protein
MELIQSKSLLAKLMATENLIIEQRNVQTAAFDVKNRVLTVPVLDKNISGYLYDLFMGHEVGHALYTPLSGMIQAHEEKIPMGIMNVLEDSRIERKIKNKYPGIRSSFIRAYKELIDKDFFGTNGTDLNEMNFIDRVNLYTKGGATQGIKFTDYEQSLVSKIEGTETYDDVMAVARLVTEYMKQQAEEHKKKHPTDEFEEDEEDGDYEGFDSEGYNDSDEWDDETETRKDNGNTDKSKTEETDEDLESEQKQEAGGTEVSSSSLETKSFTDEAYRKNEKKLFAQDGRTHYYGNIPDVDLKQAIVGHKELWKRYRESADNNPYAFKKGIDTEKFMKLRNDSKKVVGYLAKEFELRKNADQLKRASIAKTGDLNMSKLYAYQLTDDIFKKMTVVPGAKSHGLVMFLDWSGSMSNHMENTIKQLINLVMFCKKVNIPYDVYAFSSEYDMPYNSDKNFKDGDIYLNHFKLLNLMSSKMTAAEFTYAGSALVQMSELRRGWKPTWLQKGGTPLNEAVISAMKIVPEFQKQYKLQVVNTVFLTDGEGHSLNQVWYKDDKGLPRTGTVNKQEDYNSDNWRSSRQLVLRDPITKEQEIVDSNRGRELTASYIKMLKVRTNCNIVGFYVLAGRELGRELHHFYPNNYMVHDKIKAEFRKNKSLTVTNAGFDEYYLLRTEALDTDDDVTFEVKENATTRGLVSAFSKFAGNRLNNRVVLNRFIGMIS